MNNFEVPYVYAMSQTLINLYTSKLMMLSHVNIIYRTSFESYCSIKPAIQLYTSTTTQQEHWSNCEICKVPLNYDTTSSCKT